MQTMTETDWLATCKRAVRELREDSRIEPQDILDVAHNVCVAYAGNPAAQLAGVIANCVRSYLRDKQLVPMGESDSLVTDGLELRESKPLKKADRVWVRRQAKLVHVVDRQTSDCCEPLRDLSVWFARYTADSASVFMDYSVCSE